VVTRAPVDAAVIGGGTAGLRAAAACARSGFSTLIISKGAPCTGIVGLNALLDEAGDTRETFLGDTLRSAAGIGLPALAENLVDRSGEELKFLEGLGLQFHHSGRYLPRRTSGNSAARTVYTTDTTGVEILSALKRIYTGQTASGLQAVSIIKEGGQVSGLLCLDGRSGEFHLCPCRALIVASGGLGSLYARSTNSRSLSADGLLIALEAGARLRDMEFVQFEPFSLLLPSRDTFFSLSFLLQDKPRIYCEEGRAIFRDGEIEQLSKAEISLRLYERVVQLRESGRRGTLLFDCTGIKPERMELHTTLLKLCRRFKLHPETEPLPFTPAQHYMLGGIEVSERYETAVTGLFAAGEAAGGTHGADRLAGNSALDALVSGAGAAASAVEYLQGDAVNRAQRRITEAALAQERRIAGEIERAGRQPISTEQGITRLRECMWNSVGIIRSEEGLQKARTEFERLKETSESACVSGSSPQERLSGVNQLSAAEIITTAALMRRESRGVHCRCDYPGRDPSMEGSIRAVRERGRLRYEFSR
jgi:succinate dehydrogenase/fumarate reductase flavoprotein subunit